jgi:hypothetical protein
VLLVGCTILLLAGLTLFILSIAGPQDQPSEVATQDPQILIKPWPAKSPRPAAPETAPAKASLESPKDLAGKTHLLLKTYCYRCHGENGAAEGGFNYILDMEKLVARERVIPGKPDKSRLYRRVERGDMPPEEEKARPTAQEVALLRQWIEAGAPPPANPVQPLPYISTAAMLEQIHASLLSMPERDRRFARFFTLTHLANAGLRQDELQTYRLALAKLLNSLSWSKEIVNPRPVDASKTVFQIDIRDYQWGGALWKRVLQGYPYAILWEDPKAKACYELVGDELPFVRADWFVAFASRPPLYHQLLQLPETERELEKQLHIDVVENVRQERVARAGFNGSGVSRNNRLIERHPSPYGSYWRSYDFADTMGRRNLFAFPLGPELDGKGFLADGGEIIFSLPNGLNAFMLVNDKGGRLDKGPLAVVSDPRRPDRAVENGISCMSCHSRGFIPKKDQIRLHVEKNLASFSQQERETIMALYPPEEKLTALFDKDNGRFRKAVDQLGGKLTSTESITGLVAHYETELGLVTAASELGLRPAEFSEKLSQSPALLRVLGPLRIPGGTVQRQVFTEAIPTLVQELKLGVLVTPTP